MTRLKKELTKRHLIHGVSEDYGYDPYEVETSLVGICNGFIITVTYCNVVDPVFHILDLNFNEIASQDKYKDDFFFDGAKNFNPWSVWFAN